MPTGNLQVQTLIGDSYEPVLNASVTITPSDKNQIPIRQTPQVLKTNASGQTEVVTLETPPLNYSLAPSQNLPYSLYDVRVEAAGYESQLIKGCQIFPTQLALQQCQLKKSLSTRQGESLIIILPNTLVGNFPPKIPEAEEKPMPPVTGDVVLQQPVIPEFIVVHQGEPNDANAPNYTVRYKDYIKNVASCEIFSTWPYATIQANIFCIISFTLNRVYTEWYRAKGNDFTITSSTAYDQAFVFGRNIYESISKVVDDIFSTFIKRTGRTQPLLAQYCDGVNVQCPNWLAQWGSKYRGDQGENAPQILRYYYGSDIVFDTARKVEGIPISYPGFTLGLGTTGLPVRSIQGYLNRISENYPAIPKVAITGIYDINTRKAVLKFQEIFHLPQTGVVNYATWYKISQIYVAVTQSAEL